MNREDIKEKLIMLCAKIFENYGIDTDLLEYVDFVDDLGMDSITFITLIVEIEAEFDIIISDDLLLMDNFKQINNIIALIINTTTHDELQ